MPDFLTQALADGAPLDPRLVALRLVIAMVLGGIVALAYRVTRTASAPSPSFMTTLVLLAILIAMVTQVIGDNVARAFSLVGALSIVRFRTVVRDTQDTAFVIFAVVTGMAVGAGKTWVALCGIVIVSLAAWYMNRQRNGASTDAPWYVLTVRVGFANEIDSAVKSVLDRHLQNLRLLTVGTARQGIALSRTYETQVRPDRSPDDLVRELYLVEGVHGVELERRALSEDQ